MRAIFTQTLIKMNKVLLLAVIALATVSCVSKKKYAEMKAEVERMKTLESVNTSLQSRMEAMEMEQQNQVKDLRRQLEEAHTMVKEKDMELHAKGVSDLSPEQRLQLEDERRRRHETQLLEMHQKPPVNQQLDAILAKGESEARMLKSALDAAFENYQPSKASVEKLGSRVVVSIQDDALFLEGNGQVSAGGETLLNRMAAALKVRNDLHIAVVGIAADESNEARSEAMKKSGILWERMVTIMPEVAAKSPLVGAKDCTHSFSGRITGCERLEIVFEPDYEAIIDTMRMPVR